MNELLRIHAAALAPAADAPGILDNLNLSLARGEAIAICGPSGAGKTTLLRAIAGEIAPVSGTIDFDGSAPHLLARKQRARIGFVSQSHDLVEQLRVDRNVMAGALGRWSTFRAIRYLAWSSLQEAEEAGAALASVGLTGFAKRATKNLSGGEKQRVAIARALVQAPDLLLADEPVASLDPDNARAVLALLVGLAKERGMGLICSLHQPELALHFFDRVMRLENGTMREAG